MKFPIGLSRATTSSQIRTELLSWHKKYFQKFFFTTMHQTLLYIPTSHFPYLRYPDTAALQRALLQALYRGWNVSERQDTSSFHYIQILFSSLACCLGPISQWKGISSLHSNNVSLSNHVKILIVTISVKCLFYHQFAPHGLWRGWEHLKKTILLFTESFTITASIRF